MTSRTRVLVPGSGTLAFKRKRATTGLGAEWVYSEVSAEEQCFQEGV